MRSAPASTLISGENSADAPARCQPDECGGTRCRQQIFARVLLYIEPLAQGGAQHVYRIVELAALLRGPLFQNFEWYGAGHRVFSSLMVTPGCELRCAAR